MDGDDRQEDHDAGEDQVDRENYNHDHCDVTQSGDDHVEQGDRYEMATYRHAGPVHQKNDRQHRHVPSY